MSNQTNPNSNRSRNEGGSTYNASQDGYNFGPGGNIDPNNVGWIDRLLFATYGTTAEVLAKATPKDVKRARIFGSLIIIVSAFAFYSMVCAASLVITGSPTLSPTGLEYLIVFSVAALWSMFVFQVDRSLLINFSKAKSKFSLVAIRLTMIVFMGIMIAIPLELRVLQSDITSMLRDTQTEIVSQRVPEMTAVIDDQINVKEAELLRAEGVAEESRGFAREISDKADAERAHRRRPGCGPICQALEAKAAAAFAKTADFDAQVVSLKANLTSLQAEKSAVVSTVMAEASQHDGLMLRWETAHDAHPWAMLLMTLAFLTLELTPVLSKLAAPRSVTDDLEAQREREAYSRNNIEPAKAHQNEESVHGKRFYDAEVNEKIRRDEHRKRMADLQYEADLDQLKVKAMRVERLNFDKKPS